MIPLNDVKAIEWLGDRVRILDQTRLPQEEVYLELSRYQDIASAIAELKIRGAPAIGVAGAYAVALGALKIKTTAKDEFLRKAPSRQPDHRLYPPHRPKSFPRSGANAASS